MNSYNANSIETLEFRDAIRKRVAMYLGDAGMGGVYQGIREIITNSIDEYTVGYGDTIEVSISDNLITVTDNARGVPFGKRDDGTEAMEAIYTSAHSGGKFDDKIYQNVAGLNGIGAKATALSSDKFTAISKRDGVQATLTIKDGIVESFNTVKITGKPNTGTTVIYEPSKEVFHLEPVKIDFEVVKNMCETWAYLSPGLTFKLSNGKEKVSYSFKNGIRDLLKNNINKPLHKNIFYEKIEDESGNVVEVAMQWSKDRKEVPFVFTNGLENINGGTSLTGAKTSLTRTVNSLAKTKLSGESVRTGLFYIINASVVNPSFSDQTKTKVNNPELQGLASKAVGDALKSFSVKHPQEWETIVEVLIREEKAEHAAESARKKMLETEKEMKDKKIVRGFDLPDKAKDATNDSGYRELFIVEGDSAGGNMISMRDSATQAILKLKGKPLNTYNMELADAYENDEINALITLMGSGAGSVYNHSKLRYEKIIIAADADADGKHIMILVVGFYLRHAPQVIKNGNLYILVPPLYGVGKNNSVMLYSDEELELYEEKHGKQSDVKRYKGLGALNPNDTEKYLLSEDRKLKQVTMGDALEMEKLFDIFLGNKTEDKLERNKLVGEGYIE